MEYKPSLLITQSFVVSPAGSYWDYRDYIFCLCSNLSVKDTTVRLNIERGTEFATELSEAAKSAGFSNVEVTTNQPESWAGYMLEQLKLQPQEWVMPWPGDHIYVHPEDNKYLESLKKAEELGADAVTYGHMQDFEYFLDWDRVKVLYNDADYVMIEWGNKHRYRRNPKLKTAAKKTIRQELIMVPVPAFMTFRSALFKQIMEALPSKTKRWQDMEYSPADAVWSFKVLIPKQCLYRHVHGYWLEGFLKYWPAGIMPKDTKAEIESWYIRPNYNWRENLPTRHEYRNMCLQKFPYFQRYFQKRSVGEFKNEFGNTPFDPDWQKKNSFLLWVNDAIQIITNDIPRRVAAKILKHLK